jgi:hypothetical protein
MNPPPQVTWLLPVLNGMPYILETLASIATQTFREFEVIAWDNGSTDGTVEVLHAWIPHQLPGRVITGHPLDLGACLGEMVKMSSSPFCARIDADDINLPGRLSAQVAFLEGNPNVVAVGTQVREMDCTGVLGGLYKQLPLIHEAIAVRLLRRWSLWHPTVLFRREAVLRAGNYLDERPVEDYSLWLRLARVGRLANLPTILVNYRVHESSVTERAIREGILQDRIAGCVTRHGAPLYGLDAPAIKRVLGGSRLRPSELVSVWSHLRLENARFGALALALWRQEVRPYLTDALRKVPASGVVLRTWRRVRRASGRAK